MADDVTQRISTVFDVDTGKALDEIDKFRKEVDDTIKTLKELKKEKPGAAFDTLAEGLKRAGNTTKEFNKVLSTSLAQIKKEESHYAAMREQEVQRSQQEVINSYEQETRQRLQLAKQAAEGETSVLDKLKSAWQAYLAVMAIVGATIRQLWQQFVELSEGAVELTNSIYKLGASVRALQRTGMDITIASTVEQVRRLRQEFSFFTTQEVVEGIAQIQLLTRNFEFTRDEMEEVMKISTALAVFRAEIWARLLDNLHCSSHRAMPNLYNVLVLL